MSYVDSLLEIKLINDDSFLKIKETLTRIGIASNKDKKIYQSCHILKKRGLFYIVHFKELLRLDGRTVDLNDEDQNRRTDIAKLLQDWNLCTLVDERNYQSNRDNLFRILSWKNAQSWTKVPKYEISDV